MKKPFRPGTPKRTPLRPGPGPRRRRELSGSPLGSARPSLPSSGRLPSVNRARKAGNLERAHGPAEFREWIKQQPCVVCGRTPSDAAHLRNGGMSRKADVTETVPMCSTIPAIGYSGHHDEYDGRARAGGKQTFAKKYPHLDLPALAAETQRRWTLHREAA